jgi:hypothetical protein
MAGAGSPSGAAGGSGPPAHRGEELVEVRILSLPIQLARRGREHNEGLMREFTLIQLGGGDAFGVPHRLHELAEELTQRFAGFTAEPESQLAEAEARGDHEIDLVYHLPADVADAATRYGALLDEADEYCRRGEHLLTLVTPPDLLQLRQWFFEELIGQTLGKEPTPWPDWERAHGGSG